MYNEMPSQDEQQIAEEYSCKHTLERPSTNIKKAIIYFIVFVSFNVVLSILSVILITNAEVKYSFIVNINHFFSEHFILGVLILNLIYSLISLIIFLKKIIIGSVRLYQHYAPEDIRRRCLFKPTCSEYMILAVEKYGAIIGLYKGIDRLFNRCRGNIYRIDYP